MDPSQPATFSPAYPFPGKGQTLRSKPIDQLLLFVAVWRLLDRTIVPLNTNEESTMPRKGVITFKGTPMTLLGEELKVGSPAPDFTVYYFEGGLKPITKQDLLGKASIISIVPSVDTGVCAIQTKKFNQELGGLGDKVNAVTVSRDLPFAQNRFCGAESVKSMKMGSDYQDGSFGNAFGVMIDELKLLARAVVVLDKAGQVVYSEIVPEVTQEPNYEAALDALKKAQ